MRAMLNGQFAVVSPVTFLKTIAKYVPRFEGNEQQDSQELLAFVLDGLHEDLNKPMLKGVDPTLDQIEQITDDQMEEMSDKQASLIAWKKYEIRNSSIIVSMFQGQLQSRLRCLTCGQVCRFVWFVIHHARRPRHTMLSCS